MVRFCCSTPYTSPHALDPMIELFWCAIIRPKNSINRGNRDKATGTDIVMSCVPVPPTPNAGW